jgi:hypothetical protein
MTPALIRHACDAQLAVIRQERVAMFGTRLYGPEFAPCRYPQCSCDPAVLAVETVQQKEAA